MKDPYIAAEEFCLPGVDRYYECCVTVCEAPNYVETYVTPAVRRSLLTPGEDYCVMGACDGSCDTCTLRDDATKCTACPGVEMAVHASYTEDYFSCSDCSTLTDYFMYDTDHCADDGCPEDEGIYMIDELYADWTYLNCDVPEDQDEDNCLAFDTVGDGEYEDFIGLCFPQLAECEAFLTAGEDDLPDQFTYPCGEFPEEPEDDDDDDEDDDDDDFSFKPFTTILALAALLAL
jgi:hypothetical protein